MFFLKFNVVFRIFDKFLNWIVIMLLIMFELGGMLLIILYFRYVEMKVMCEGFCFGLVK